MAFLILQLLILDDVLNQAYRPFDLVTGDAGVNENVEQNLAFDFLMPLVVARLR